jgi:hypothetical protein
LIRGVGCSSDGWEPAQATGRRRAKAGGGERRRAAADSPAGTGFGVSGHDSKRGRHLRDARKTAERSRAAARATTRRSGGSTRRRGVRAPATALGRRGARGRRRAARGAPHLLPQLLGRSLAAERRRRRGSTAAATSSNGGAARVSAGRAQRLGRLGRRSSEAAAALNSPGGHPWRAGHAEAGRVRAGLGGAAAEESGAATGWG